MPSYRQNADRATVEARVNDLLGPPPPADLGGKVGRRLRELEELPRADLYGLSTRQARRLVIRDWLIAGGLKIHVRASFEELEDTNALHNARVLLASIRDEAPVRATKAGNLTRSGVVRIGQRFRWPEGSQPDWCGKERLNEADVVPLHVLRVLLESRKTLELRKGAFHLTVTGHALLRPSEAAILYTLLFTRFFRAFPLSYLGGIGGQHAALQRTIAYAFWVLKSEAEEWAEVDTLADIVWIEELKDEEPGNWLPHLWSRITQTRLIDPLVDFGLLERRELPPDGTRHRYEVRKTRLFDRVLLFTLDWNPAR